MAEPKVKIISHIERERLNKRERERREAMYRNLMSVVKELARELGINKHECEKCGRREGKAA